MFKYVLLSFKGYKLSYIKNDVIAGIMVAALTIPVAMGYAQVAGLPPIYGLYASILPAIGYALFASSPQTVFGADASTSAITGSALAMFGIAATTQQAVAAAALLSLFAAAFLFLFALLRVGRFAAYISMPVMSGFMSGIAISIMLGQLPKILGITGSGDDFFGNIKDLVTGIAGTNLISLAMGAAAAALILLGKRFLPKLPVGLVVMVLGTALCALLRLDNMGVAVVGTIPSGFPALSFPAFWNTSNIGSYIGAGLVVAIVIFADALMTSRSFAVRNHYTLDNNREIFSFGIANFMASLSGGPPTSASMSYTAAAEQFKSKTQLVSLVAATLIALVVAFLGGLLYYMPQPLLGGIVLASLVGMVDLVVIRNLWRQSRGEAAIWLVSAVGVLVVGVLFGVLVGVILSFIAVIIGIVKPPQAYLGVVAGQAGFYDLENHDRAKAIPGVVIYRFSARLFFGNFSLFRKGVHRALGEENPKTIIIDAAGINSIDATAAGQLKELLHWLERKGLTCYFAGQTDALNQQFHDFGLDAMLAEKGRLTKTVADALKAAGITAT